MKGMITGYLGGRHTKRVNQFLVRVEGIGNVATASALIGRTLSWKTPGEKEIRGIVTSTHGRRGLLIARFRRGMAGSINGSKVEILE